MSIDPRWRRRVEAMQRAGLQYIAKTNLQAPILGTEDADAMPRESSKETAAPSPPPAVSSLFAQPTVEEAPAAPERALAEKNGLLEVLRQDVVGCTRCTELVNNRTQTVFSDGTPMAELCFLGEAPGADEDRAGVPFVGAAGQLLTKIIEACKLRRDEVYICNVLKCRPPGNRPPEPREMAHCEDHLARQLDIVRPKMIVSLGKYAACFVLKTPPDKTPIVRLRGQWHDYRGIPVMLTLHPAYLLRNPAAKRDVWEDMKVVMRRLGRPVD